MLPRYSFQWGAILVALSFVLFCESTKVSVIVLLTQFTSGADQWLSNVCVETYK